MTSAVWLACLALLFGPVPLWIGILDGASLALVLGTALNLDVVGAAVAAWLAAFMNARRWLHAVHVGTLAGIGALLLVQ